MTLYFRKSAAWSAANSKKVRGAAPDITPRLHIDSSIVTAEPGGEFAALLARAATRPGHSHLRQPRAEALVRERLLQRVELDVRGGHEQQRQEQAE